MNVALNRQTTLGPLKDMEGSSDTYICPRQEDLIIFPNILLVFAGLFLVLLWSKNFTKIAMRIPNDLFRKSFTVLASQFTSGLVSPNISSRFSMQETKHKSDLSVQLTSLCMGDRATQVWKVVLKHLNQCRVNINLSLTST